MICQKHFLMDISDSLVCVSLKQRMFFLFLVVPRDWSKKQYIFVLIITIIVRPLNHFRKTTKSEDGQIRLKWG